jgi:tRNA(Ile)-lysidine synthase
VPHTTPDIGVLLAAALGRDLADSERLAVAVSGGPDSVALLLLAAARWPGRVTALTVDHRLRPEAADEAATVVRQCRAAGIPAETLVWDADKPGTGLPAAARAARYRLLGDRCRRAGVGLLLTAHHADDQAETLLMRLARGSGGGLAGIRARRPLGPGVTLVRPLLRVTKRDLVAIAAASEWPIADDPGNRDARQDRIRARRLLAATAWLPAGQLAEAAAHAAEAEDALDWMAERAWAGRVVRQGDRLQLDCAGLPVALVRRMVLRALAEFGAVAPRGAALSGFIAALAAGKAATLGGVRARGGVPWCFTTAPVRRQIDANSGQNDPKTG